MNKQDIDFLISIQDLEQPDFDNACLERENNRLNKEIDRLNNIISEVNRVLESILFELDQTGEAEQVIEKIEYCVKELKEKE